MSTLTRPIPRTFYRIAYQRFEEAEVLFEDHRVGGLAGCEEGNSYGYDAARVRPSR